MRDGAAWRTTGPSLVALAVLVVVLLRMAFDAGGYFPDDYVEAGAICFLALAVVGAAVLPRLRPTRHALVALGTLAALAAWTALSATWSPQPDEALLDFQRTLTYVGIFALALLAAGNGRRTALVLWAALAVATVVVGAGLLSRLQPDLVTGVPDVEGLTGYRLSHPLTYWNAFGGMAAFGTVLAVGLGSDPRAAAAVRALGAALAVPLGVAMYLSLSRGSWLALIAGGVVLILLTPYRVSALLTAGLAGGAVAICILRLEGLDALVEEPLAGDGQRAQGDDFSVFLALMTLAVAGGQLAIAQIRSSPDLQYAAEQVRGRVLAYGAIAVIVTGIVGYGVAGGALEGRSADALDDATSWVERQWDDFLLTSTYAESGRDRLVTSRGTRSDLYRVSIDAFEAHPLRGDGAGAFEWRWFQAREVQESTRESHSLWLGTLGELGIIGAGLLLGFIVALGAGVVRGLRSPTGLRRGQTAAVAAAGTVWVVHSFADWDWQMPALTGTVLLAMAALLPSGRARRREPRAAEARRRSRPPSPPAPATSSPR